MIIRMVAIKLSMDQLSFKNHEIKENIPDTAHEYYHGNIYTPVNMICMIPNQNARNSEMSASTFI